MDNRVERLPFARLLRDSALELLLTLFMLFGVATAARCRVQRLKRSASTGREACVEFLSDCLS
jgi:hypothetical protein